MADATSLPGGSAPLDLKRHCAECRRQDGCVKCKYIRLRGKWEAATPILLRGMSSANVPSHLHHLTAGSWLAAREVLNSDGSGKSGDAPTWTWGCIVCNSMRLTGASAKEDDPPRAWANFRVKAWNALQMSNLRRHHRLALHRKATTVYLGLGGTITQAESKGAPGTDEFLKVLAEVQKGVSPSAGVEGVGRAKKIWP